MFNKRGADDVSDIAKQVFGLILFVWLILIGNGQPVDAQIYSQTKISDLVIAEVVADDPSEGMNKFVDFLKKEREKGPTRLVVRAAGIEVEVAPEPRTDIQVPVYPNPLFLLVSIDAQGTLELNSEKLGNLTDPSAFTKRLGEIFKEREENGVFRQGSNDIEKTVSLRLHSTLKVSDLNKVVSLMDSSGSDPIILLIDPPAEVREFRSPLVPIKPKKRKKP